MTNPHKLVRSNTSITEVQVRMCADCSTPLIEVPDSTGGWYCIHCKYFPSMQDTYMQKVYISIP